MTGQNFLAVFGDYIEEPYTSIFKDCEMLRLDADPSARTISTVMKNGSIIKVEHIRECQRAIAKKAGLQSVRFTLKYLPTLFDISYFPELITELKGVCSVVNGFLDDAEAEFDGEVLHISLKNGGKNILMQAGADKQIERLVYERFTKKITASFEGIEMITEADFPEPPPIVIREAPPAPAPRPSNGERPSLETGEETEVLGGIPASRTRPPLPSTSLTCSFKTKGLCS